MRVWKDSRIGLTLGIVAAFLAGASLAALALVQAETQEGAVTGIGGVFFKVEDPERFKAWYREHLGIRAGDDGASFFWRQGDDADAWGRTVWSPFPKDTDYFGPGDQKILINYRVRHLDGLLEKLRASGVEQVGAVEEYRYGRFAWIVDVEGNRVELWEPFDLPPEELERRRKASAP